MCLGGLFVYDNDADDTDDNNNAGWTFHDYMGSLTFIPNEPKVVEGHLLSKTHDCITT